tara:strand:- start:52826 stop:53032 length:207 start_codon:yes stop_codon:yes gene_type:complete
MPLVLSPRDFLRIENAMVMWASTDLMEIFKYSAISMLVIPSCLLRIKVFLHLGGKFSISFFNQRNKLF